MLYHNQPSLDLHGEQSVFVETLVNNFVLDHYKMQTKVISIVHGKSTNILTKEVHKTLSKNKFVTKYNLNNWNLGETIVYIKKR